VDDWANQLALVTVWGAQQAYCQHHGRYASSPSDVAIALASVTIEAITNQFEASLGNCRIDQVLRWSFGRSG
jgi:hypothetical protein